MGHHLANNTPDRDESDCTDDNIDNSSIGEIMFNSASDIADCEDETNSHSDGSGTKDTMIDSDGNSPTESNLNHD